MSGQPGISGRRRGHGCLELGPGIRDSLAILLFHYARVGAKLWLPADNYPVYGELVRAAGLLPVEFPTLPEPVWPSGVSGGSPELLVVTNPLKPLGRWFKPTLWCAHGFWRPSCCLLCY